MPAERILIIEDDKDILELVRYNLEKAGFAVESATDGAEGLRMCRKKPPDALLLDLMLPSIDGLDICRALKKEPETKDLPILMISARGEETDVVVGLELGADDYLVKPFSPRVLLARLKAVLRRNTREEPDAEAVVHLHDFKIDPRRHEVRWKDQPLNLTPTEFSLLHLLSRRPGWVFTRQQIVDGVRGQDYAVTDRAVDVQVVGLRKKLGDAARLVETVRGIGYRMKAP